MPDYAILLYPSANRVYTESAQHLLRAELAIFGDTVLETPITEIDNRRLGGIDYVTFSAEQALSDNDISHLSNLSSRYALFELVNGLCKPLTIHPSDKFDSDLLSIQKYSGKTNELFTKLLFNLTVLATDKPATLLGGNAHVLDPLCGRGTTMNQAMMYGLDATGFDTDTKDFEAYSQFIKTWLRTKRIKHTAETGQLRRNKVQLGRRLEVEYGLTKEQYKSGNTRTVRFFNADTFTTDEILKPSSVDLIVTDAPYGIQHGSQQERSLRRSPHDLLAAAIPVWTRTLRNGGAIGISWNTNVVKRSQIIPILNEAGLHVHTGDAFAALTHRVDQAIIRDILVASKPA